MELVDFKNAEICTTLTELPMTHTPLRYRVFPSVFLGKFVKVSMKQIKRLQWFLFRNMFYRFSPYSHVHQKNPDLPPTIERFCELWRLGTIPYLSTVLVSIIGWIQEGS